MAKQKSPERRLAEQIAAQKNASGIKTSVKSQMRYLQRAAATGDKQKIKSPRFQGVKKTTAKRARKIVVVKKEANEAHLAELKKQQDELAAQQEKLEKEIAEIAQEIYPRKVSTAGASIDCPDAPNPLAIEEIDETDDDDEDITIAVKAYFQISSDRKNRTIRLFLTAREAKKVIKAKSLYDALARWTNSKDGAFLQGASISNVESMEIE